MKTQEEYPFGFNDSEILRMHNHNPYKRKIFWGLISSEWKWWNNIYLLGWQRGKYFAAEKILEYIKENNLKKEDFKPLIESVIATKIKDGNN